MEPAPPIRVASRTVTRRMLIRLVDLAAIVGVSHQRASVLRRRPDFPEPVDQDGLGELWAAGEIRAWTRAYPFGARRWGPR
jgi:hypothetical protein